MNKAEKAVEQVKLDRERAVLDALTEHFEYALKGINERLQVLQSMPETQSTVYRIDYQKVIQKQVSAIVENLHANVYQTIDQYRHDAYTTGFVGTMYDLHSQSMPIIIPINRDAVLKAVQHDTKLTSPLYDALGIDTKKMSKQVSKELSRGLASGLTYDDIARNIRNTTKAPLARAKVIARTEGHRIHEQSSQDAAVAAKEQGADLVKQWDATLDGDTRPNHRMLDGQIRELDEPFEVGGYRPMHPGDFGTAGEDCNCRCLSLKRARWELDEDELAELKKRAEFFGLDKSDQFEEFERKYLKAAEEEGGKPVKQTAPKPKTAAPKSPKTIDNSGKSGIIHMGRFNTVDDPMREVTGAGIESNPEEIQEILKELEASGVDVLYRSDDMAYSPGLRPGKPGQFIISKAASYSAWVHEYTHFSDDRDDGFPGMRIFMDAEKCKQREIHAYDAEIDLATKAGRQDIVERLESLKAKEVSKYDEGTDED